MRLKDIYKIAIIAAIEAGKEIMEIYDNEDFQVESKNDNSPLTIADKRANDIIIKHLVPTGIPIISEENKQLDFSERKAWEKCWIVDPLDGTKEFIKRNGEFTVNIALIENQKSIFGVIYVPASRELFYGDVVEGKSFKGILQEDNNFSEGFIQEIKPSSGGQKIRVVGSRTHMSQETLDYIDELKRIYNKDIEVVSKGSSLKFCLVAEGKAEVYPRFAPTMEWDTAAGQAICEAVGLKVIDYDSQQPVRYNRENLLNNYFLVSNFG